MLPRRRFIKTSADLLRHHRLAVASRAKGSEHAMPLCAGPARQRGTERHMYGFCMWQKPHPMHSNKLKKTGLSVEV